MTKQQHVVPLVSKVVPDIHSDAAILEWKWSNPAKILIQCNPIAILLTILYDFVQVFQCNWRKKSWSNVLTLWTLKPFVVRFFSGYPRCHLKSPPRPFKSSSKKTTQRSVKNIWTSLIWTSPRSDAFIVWWRSLLVKIIDLLFPCCYCHYFDNMI